MRPNGCRRQLPIREIPATWSHRMFRAHQFRLLTRVEGGLDLYPEVVEVWSGVVLEQAALVCTRMWDEVIKVVVRQSGRVRWGI